MFLFAAAYRRKSMYRFPGNNRSHPFWEYTWKGKRQRWITADRPTAHRAAPVSMYGRTVLPELILFATDCALSTADVSGQRSTAAKSEKRNCSVKRRETAGTVSEDRHLHTRSEARFAHMIPTRSRKQLREQQVRYHPDWTAI